ncbi:hypothetical protein RND71_025181 [Anisodus tanguticus]|uniref:Uncharacterized protein n=1 Tax=Anisodus tanguticus TaxID=243964 RepID=A0AAE1RPQ3_9SOLA|nr:hypothetical protein RND71_025181 [Anisodus tanguticus]
MKPTKPNDGHPVWEVPCGNREHTEIVSAFTFISAVVSALLIIVASLRYSGNIASNVLKQSRVIDKFPRFFLSPFWRTLFDVR